MIGQTYCGVIREFPLVCQPSDGPCPSCLRDYVARLEARNAELEAQAAAQAEGVVVPKMTDELFHEIRNYLHNLPDASWIGKRSAERICAIVVSRLSTIPASRVLGEGEVAVSVEEWEGLNKLAALCKEADEEYFDAACREIQSKIHECVLDIRDLRAAKGVTP